MEHNYINSAILAVFVVVSLYIAYQFGQDYKWGQFMNCIERMESPSERGGNGICNIILLRDTSVYAPHSLLPQSN